MVCARLNFFKIFNFIFSPRRSRRGTLGISSPGGPVEEPLKPFCSFFLFVVFRRPSCFNGDPWDRHLTWTRPQTRKYLGADLRNIWKNKKNVPKFQTTNQIIKPLEASIFDLDLCPCSGWAPKLPRLFGQVPTPPALVPSKHWIGRKIILYKGPIYIILYHGPVSPFWIGKKIRKKTLDFPWNHIIRLVESHTSIPLVGVCWHLPRIRNCTK